MHELMDENDKIRAELRHWKANHADVMNRLKVFTDRPDLPAHMMERRSHVAGLLDQIKRLRSEKDSIAKRAIDLMTKCDKHDSVTFDDVAETWRCPLCLLQELRDLKFRVKTCPACKGE